MFRILLPVLFFLSACTPTTPPTPAPGNNATATAPALDTISTRKALLSVHADPRDEWQQPDELIAFMGNDISGWTIADLFADDGYFTFKLIDAGANVIAIVNDLDKYEALIARKTAAGLGDDRLIVRAVPVGDPGLAMGEADCGLIVHAFPGIQDKKGYLKLLRNGLRKPSVLFMVEWKKKETPVGPPMAQRMTAEQIMDAFLATGFTDLSAQEKAMPHDVLFMMTDPMEEYVDPK